MDQNFTVVKCQLLQLVRGEYTVYVFQNLDTNEYIMCTKLPNWNSRDIDIGQTGFLSYKFVIGGISTWYNKEKDCQTTYRYTANYFQDFVPLTHVINGNTIVDQLMVG